MHWKPKGTHGIAHETSLDLETETKYGAISRLETETETLEMPETRPRPRRDSRLVSVREIVETENLADPLIVAILPIVPNISYTQSLETKI